MSVITNGRLCRTTGSRVLRAPVAGRTRITAENARKTLEGGVLMMRSLLKSAVKVCACACVSVCATALLSGNVWASTEIEEMKAQIKMMTEQLQKMQARLDAAEQTQVKTVEETRDLDKRVSKAELHTVKDKLNLGIELEPKAWSIHQSGVRMAPQSFMAGFFTDYNPANPMMGGFNGATLAQAQQMIQGMKSYNMVPAAEKTSLSNDLVYTLRFRLNADAKVNDNLSATARLAAYKAWGDSSTVHYNSSGTSQDMYLDGNSASQPTGDVIHLERAYLNYKDTIGKLAYNLSLGRRPSTDGPPSEVGRNALEGGSPHASIINWQFDGASLTFGLEDLTDIPGMAFKLCYGVGFDSQYGTTSTYVPQSNLQDVNMGGFIFTLYDDERTKVEANYAHAWGLTDGFTGQAVMPFYAYKQNGKYYFAQNNAMFISRMEPTTNLGDWDAVSLLAKTSFFDGRFHIFVNGAWSHTHPTKISANPYYELLGVGLLNSNGEMKERDGFAIWAGLRLDIPQINGKIGFEYNYGTKYWLPMTGAEDTLIASKLATRGHVFEPYYIQQIKGDNFFLKAGAQFYKYEYSGSGSQLGEPVRIRDANALDSIFPIIEEMQIYYLSLVLKF